MIWLETFPSNILPYSLIVSLSLPIPTNSRISSQIPYIRSGDLTIGIRARGVLAIWFRVFPMGNNFERSKLSAIMMGNIH